MRHGNDMRTPPPGPVDDTGAPGFHAVIRPHRSLGPKGFLVLMAVICAISFTAGTVFFLMGAWPVFGFFGLDVLLVYLAFRLNYRSGRAEEHVLLDGAELVVRRISPAGRLRGEWSFTPYWVRLHLTEHPDGSSKLALVSHGRRLDIAAVLSPAERADFADALGAALKAARG